MWAHDAQVCVSCDVTVSACVWRSERQLPGVGALLPPQFLEKALHCQACMTNSFIP